MKLINICAALTFLMLLASCGSSSDPEVESLIEYLQTGSEAMSAKDSKCYAKGVKKGLTDEQWGQYLTTEGIRKEDEKKAADGMSAEESMEAGFAELGGMMEMFPVFMAAALKCGIPLGK